MYPLHHILLLEKRREDPKVLTIMSVSLEDETRENQTRQEEGRLCDMSCCRFDDDDGDDHHHHSLLSSRFGVGRVRVSQGNSFSEAMISFEDVCCRHVVHSHYYHYDTHFMTEKYHYRSYEMNRWWKKEIIEKLMRVDRKDTIGKG